ncbi:MAG TPA: DUF2155 domain-containing protein [Caulobacteraceae bacterium]|jgi:hypothetical protein|nr:DUF2155 domain-containing protein [Caulobacteraceae bacterium]
MRRARLGLGLAAGVAIAAVAGVAVIAQPTGGDSSGATSSQAPAPPASPPVVDTPPASATPPDSTDQTPPPPKHPKPASTNSLAPKPASPPPPPPPPPAAPRPVRAPFAVLQGLDKVTAETMRFAAPVGQPVRYKNLVFTVKACETSGLGQAEPQSQAYVVIVFAPFATGGVAAPPPKVVFKGWLFANSPSLNPFVHPVYDAWLIACMDQAPPK